MPQKLCVFLKFQCMYCMQFLLFRFCHHVRKQIGDTSYSIKPENFLVYFYLKTFGRIIF